MKNRIALRGWALVLGLALLMSQAAFAEADGAVQTVYDALVAQESDYSKTKALYTGFYPQMVYTETLEENGFTIAVSGNEYMNGSWTYTRDGDFVTVEMDAFDFTGRVLAMDVLRAAGSVFGVNGSLLNGYVSGVSALNTENGVFRTETEGDRVRYFIRITAPFELTGLEEMALTEDVLAMYGFAPLGEDYVSQTVSFGKVNALFNGSKSGGTLLIAEYGGLDELARQGIVSMLNVLQPDGGAAFAAAYGPGAGGLQLRHRADWGMNGYHSSMKDFISRHIW